MPEPKRESAPQTPPTAPPEQADAASATRAGGSAASPLPPRRPLRLGLTGGIGSGKSRVAAILVEAGAALLDADAIARAATAPGGPAIEPLRQAFGNDSIQPDGALDRQAMRQRMIDDPGAKAVLESIIHPLVRAEIDRRAEAAGDVPCLVYDIPLLVESGPAWRERLDRILVVDCDEETQVRRVMARDGWPEATVRAIIARQATREQRRAVADAVILNEGIGLDELRRRVLDAVLQWTPGLSV